MKQYKFIISGGGTGGHIYPAISIADRLLEVFPKSDITFVGSIGRMEMKTIPKYGYKIKGLFISGLKRKIFSFTNLFLPFKLLISFLQSIFIIVFNKPDFVIGTGGYASFPIVYVSTFFRIPTLIQEQNSLPGIANKYLSKHVKYISVAYNNMDRFFPIEKLFYTGNPVRKSITNKIDIDKAKESLGIDKSKLVLTVLGGSLGSKKINELIYNNLDYIKSKEIILIWQCGKTYYDLYKNQASEDIILYDFISEIDTVYYSSDIIIARSGALTLSELAIVGKPSILIPSPNVAEDHQFHNAKAISDLDAAICLVEQEADLLFKSKLDILIKDEEYRKNIASNISKLASPDASTEIVSKVKNHLSYE
ncbi:MAG TPA: undecaprenyldiphospho-muramoylpentapeptide beta-N-acetylglucosaminyltransferase [Flavobacteriaceae bacterium]|nr:undecaprenyldiphospho-muramoylpentapeptide beta-N-acetylglucosaminyltransferase [Flavobacteriaceae bacterium]